MGLENWHPECLAGGVSMSDTETMEYLKTASVVPSSRDSLFVKAVELPTGDFSKILDASAKALGGFSVVAPRQVVAVVPDSPERK
jgi:hypothetical protein